MGNVSARSMVYVTAYKNDELLYSRMQIDGGEAVREQAIKHGYAIKT